MAPLDPPSPVPEDNKTPSIRLEEGYYLDNFLTVLDTVEGQDSDLLKAEERRFRDDFQALDLAAQRLYVRLISRRGPCFRRDRLAYDEIPDLDGALRALQRAGFADDGSTAPIEEWLALLLRAEAWQVADELLSTSIAKTSRKDTLLSALTEEVEAADLRQHLEATLQVVRPLGQDILAVYRLLYFGNLGQDWTEFVLRDLGVVSFEPYELRRELRHFDCRQAIDDSLHMRQQQYEAHRLMAAGDDDGALVVAQQVAAAEALWHPITERRRHALLLAVARQMERCAAVDDALDLYRRVSRPPARERRVRLLEKQRDLAAALELCEAMASAPNDESEVVFARRFAHQLRRKQGEKLPPWQRPKRPRRSLRLLRQDGVSVERRALEALAEEGLSGFHAENWLWKCLFGLAFWDIIFAPVAGAFQHAFQYGPLDLHSADFRPRRRDLIERRLDDLRHDDDLPGRLLEIYERKQGTANRWVAWHPNLRPRLVDALQRLDGHQLATVCDRLSRHPGRYRRGFPDLFVWSDDEPTGFQLFEVKAPGDQLRPEQGAWIDFLNRHGISSRVLRVEWEG